MELIMNVLPTKQARHLLVHALRVAVVAVGLASVALVAPASPVESRTVHVPESASLYDTYHDLPTGFVFVKLPAGWRFVGRDIEGLQHAVFHDAPTGFVFVRTSDGWRFIAPKS
jgi:hypothetical protein